MTDKNTDQEKPLEERISEQRTPIKLPFGYQWNPNLYKINENGYYVSEHHPIAAKVCNAYLKAARWILRVEYKKE